VEKNKSKRCILKVGNKIDEETVETKKIVSHLFSGEKKSDFKKKLFLEKIISIPVNVSLNIVLDTLGEPQHSDNQEKVLIYLDRHFCQSLTRKKEDPIVFFCFIFYDAIPEDQTNSKFQIITQKVVSNNSFCPYCFAKPL
jgi:hypothetical protein